MINNLVFLIEKISKNGRVISKCLSCIRVENKKIVQGIKNSEAIVSIVY